MVGSKHIVLSLLVISLVSFIEVIIVSADKIRKFIQVPLGRNQLGPEALAFDCNGEGPYVGISDGRILKWEGEYIGWTQFAVTSLNRSTSCDGVIGPPMEQQCGRPLGLRFDLKTCELYIADSSFGLMKVGPNGGIASLLANTAEGIPFGFTNGLDLDYNNALVYFTDTSSNYRRWETLQAINNGDRSGRFMKYDIKTGNVTILLKDLSFANGVAVSKKKDFVLVAEATPLRILKYWVAGPKAETYEVFLELPGRPDNINRDARGDFWIAVKMVKSIKVDKFGKILETLESDEIVDPSDIQEFKDRLWIGFFDQPYVYRTT